MIGKYIRLSSQDDDCRPGEKAESNSVVNQRSLLDHYIASHPDLADRHALEFIDDGHTGFNFDRPGIQALFTAVRRGEIDCILVKDLSRFGRNSVEAGEYLERVFPLLNVRFIAVNDGLDTKTKLYGLAGDLDVGARNIINELYSRNVSTNVKTAKRQYAARGECIAAYPFYGYIKGTQDRRRLEIDPPAAEVVRRIFNLWLEGHFRSAIADRLNEEHVPSPSMRKCQLGVKRTSWSKRRDEVPWTEAAVWTILQNERYTGKLISLRSTRREIGNPNQSVVPKENWIVVPDAFEPIISEETFQRAQALFRVVPPRARIQSNRPRQLFSRKVFCGICGMSLAYQRVSKPYYKCAMTRGQQQEECKSVRIAEDDLKACVLSELRAHITTEQKTDVEDSATMQARITALEQRIEKQWSAKKDAFVRWSDGLISKAEYKNICAEKQREIQRLRGEIEKLSSVTTGHRNDESYPKLADTKELTREILDTLVQAVHVFDDGHVKIEWKGFTASEDVREF